jgi:valine--pyruvate aminotransferase
MLESGAIRELVAKSVRPFYERKAGNARRWITQYFDDALDYHVHASEGALFLWVWLRGLPITAQALYERLKYRGVLVVAGHHFAIGSSEAARHAGECLRVSFAMDDAVVEEGIAILADEVAQVYAAG